MHYQLFSQPSRM